MKLARYLILFSLMFTLFTCKKEIDQSFPRGNWMLKNFTRSQAEHYYGFISISDYDYLINNCSFHFDGSKKLIFNSSKGEEYFKIKELKLYSRNDHYNVFDNNTSIVYEVNHYYQFQLKNRKGKNFEFKYSLINDTIMVGEFWEKNQDYYRYDAPNMTKDKQGFYYQHGAEILGVYYLQK